MHWLLIISVLLSASQCLCHEDHGNVEGKHHHTPEDQAYNAEALKVILSGYNNFTSEIYNILRESSLSESGNLVVSPISISAVMGMLRNGARNETVTAIARAMGFPDCVRQTNAGFFTLLRQLRSDDQATLEFANRLYPTVGFQLSHTVEERLNRSYSAGIQQLDYTNAGEACKTINTFVANATRNKIENFISPDSITPEGAKLILVNAVYFKALWKRPFLGRTTPELFYTTEQDTEKALMMEKENEDVLYGSIPELDAKAIQVPYEGDRFSLIVLLPNSRTGLSEVETNLRNFTLEQILSNLNSTSIHLKLPKFKLESTINLEKPLTQLGAGIIFSKEANFSRFAENEADEKLYVSQAVQKAFIEVNEEGSSAAAATGVKTVPVSLPIPSQVRFFAHHPFHVILAAKVEGQQVPLFLARIANPNT